MEKESTNIQAKIFSTEFNKFCRKNFHSRMEELEKTRKYYILAIVLVSIILSALAYSLVYLGGINDSTLKLAIFIIVATIAIDTFICKLFKNKAKGIVLEKLLSFIGDFKIDKSKDNIGYIGSLDLFDKFNEHSIDDRIVGKYGSLDLDITEVNLKYVTHNGKHRSERTIFNGVLTTVPSNKKFQGSTIIKKQSLLDYGKSGMQKVNLEDPEFENMFEVYSTDQIEARYLITAAFMERMVKLSKKSPMITVSFEYGNVNIAISSSKDWFEIPLMKPATDIKHYRQIILELLIILKIIDSLKLEQNIGM